MVNTAVLVLHGQHPVQIVADFFKEFRVLGEFARDVPAERIHILREVLVDFEQRPHGNAGVHDILAVITSIVPAAIRPDYLAVALAASRLVGAVNNHTAIFMACSASPLARILGFQRHTGALVVEPLEASLYQIVIDILAHHNRGAHIFLAAEKAVGTGFLDGRNIKSLHFFTTVFPVIDHGSLEFQDSLPIKVADFEPVGITTRVDNRLFCIRGKTQLVHEGACKSRRKGHGNSSRTCKKRILGEFHT